jgi:hypothetical protein
MNRIQCLRPNVTREEAVAQFCPRGPVGWAQRLGLGSLRCLADFYVPFELFQVEIWNGRQHSIEVLGLDAVAGSLDPYRFQQAPGTSSLMSVETRNCPPVCLSSQRAGELLVNKLRRVLFSSGFFRIRDLRIMASPLREQVYVPYWVAFRGHGTRAHISVIDAVRRTLEGAKVRHLLRTWLLDRDEASGSQSGITPLLQPHLPTDKVLR